MELQHVTVYAPITQNLGAPSTYIKNMHQAVYGLDCKAIRPRTPNKDLVDIDLYELFADFEQFPPLQLCSQNKTQKISAGSMNRLLRTDASGIHTKKEYCFSPLA